VNEPRQSSVVGIFNEPWYVIIGIIAAVVIMQVAEKRLKAAGRWPYKGDNAAVDRLIWSVVLLLIAVIGGLTAHWVSQ
jgi:hypothetical protein